MLLLKEDVIQIAAMEYELENPRCLIVLNADNFNRNNRLSFQCLDVSNGFVYRTWFSARGGDDLDKFASKIAAGIRILACISFVSESDLMGKQMILRGIDLERERTNNDNLVP